jgi:Mrp family chromosome partitioning ATPase
MKTLLTELAEQADIVVLDSPPAMALSDTALLSTQTDGVLLVLYADKTRREMARRALEALRQVQARVVGVVLNRVPARGRGYYYYYYQYYHSGGYYGSGDGRNGNAFNKSRRRSLFGSRQPVEQEAPSEKA